jgi:hypothetical protein
MQSYEDAFELLEGDTPRTPATPPGSVLHKGSPEDWVSNEEQSTSQSEIGKLLQMMKWTRPEILNAII